jgi:hypothetical protein
MVHGGDRGGGGDEAREAGAAEAAELLLIAEMSAEDRRELTRAQKVSGLADEIAFLRMRLRKANLEESEDVERISLAMERLSRLVGTEDKFAGRKTPDAAARLIASLQAFEDQIGPIPESKFGGPIIRPADDGQADGSG